MQQRIELLLKRYSAKLSIAALGLGLASIGLAQPAFTYKVIPMPEGTSSFTPWIKDDGTVGGGTGVVDAGQGIQLTQCYTSKDGVVTVVPTPSANCHFMKANQSGDFTGYLDIPGVQGTHLFRYHDGGFEMLDSLLPRTLPGATSSWPNAMNDQGQIAGFAYIQDLKPAPSTSLGPAPAIPQFIGRWDIYAFVYSGGQIRELPNLGGIMNTVYGMNSLGDAVGYASSKMPSHISDPPVTTHAVLYPHDGGIVDLGTAGGANSEANAINTAGQIVGRTSVVPGEMDPSHHLTYHPFLYENGSMKVLPAPGIDSSAMEISEQGEVLGVYHVAKADGSVDYADQLFYWFNDGSDQGKLVDLQSLVQGLPNGIVLTEAHFRSGGKIVAGARQADGSGSPMTLLLTPVQPQ